MSKENITVSDWLQFLEYCSTINSSSQLGYVTLLVTLIIAVWAVMAASKDVVLTFALLGVVVIIWISTRKDLGNKTFFKGKVAGELAAAIVSKKYPKLKNVNDIEDCWLEFDKKIDILSWNDRRKLLSIRNNESFKKWFEETSGKYQKIESEKT